MAIISINIETAVPYRRTILYKALVDPVFVPPPEVITVDKWLVALAVPTRRGGLLAQLQAPDTFDPTRFVEPTTVDKWHTPLAVPTRRGGVAQQLAPDSFDPVRFDFVTPEVLTVDKWLAPLAVPTRRGGLSINNQPQAFFVEAAPFAELVSIDRWLQPLAEPKRFPRNLATYEQPYISFVQADPFPETVTAVWAQPLSVPTRRIRFAEHPAYFTPGYFFPPNVDVPVDRWFSPLSIPTRRKLPVSEYPYLTFVKAAPFGEDVKVSSWVLPLSVPTRRIGMRTLLMEGCAVLFVPVVVTTPFSQGYIIT